MNRTSKTIVATQDEGGHIGIAQKNMSNIKIQPTKMRISMIY